MILPLITLKKPLLFLEKQFVFLSISVHGSTVVYHRHVIVLATTTNPREFQKIFATAGFNGCIGSTNATHVGMLPCTNWETHNHLGHKLNVPSKTYSFTVTNY